MIDWSIIDRRSMSQLEMMFKLVWIGRRCAWRGLGISIMYNLIALIFRLIDWILVTTYLRHKYPSSYIRIQRILLRHKLDEMSLASDLNFLRIHEKCMSSFEELLMSPNWMIYAFSEKFVHFVELPKTYDQYQAQQAPFCYLAQFTDAKRIATMSIDTFLSAMQAVSVFNFVILIHNFTD
jgi:hypothetical protein